MRVVLRKGVLTKFKAEERYPSVAKPRVVEVMAVEKSPPLEPPPPCIITPFTYKEPFDNVIFPYVVSCLSYSETAPTTWIVEVKILTELRVSVCTSPKFKNPKSFPNDILLTVNDDVVKLVLIPIIVLCIDKEDK